jgi:multisubunit Na+/H+ antiporter MnhF subunit
MSDITPTTLPKDIVAHVTTKLTEDDLKDVALERLKWENRRKIANNFSYAAITFAFLSVAIVVIGGKEIADRYILATDLLTWLYMGLLTPVTLYFGSILIDKFTGSGKKT